MNIEEVKKQYPELVSKRKVKNVLNPGDKINSWTILYQTNNSKSNHIQYVCQCDCGTIAVVLKTSLVNNKSKNCKHCGGTNLLGQRFGKLVVVSKADSKNNRGYWHCVCDCGNECDVNTNLLTAGHTQSCGCLHKEKQHERREDLTKQKFGKLTPLYPILSKKGDKQTFWHCICDCGNECDIQTGHLKSGATQSCGCTKSFQEENIIKLLKKNNIPFEYQYSFEDVKQYKFDFYINNEYIIEYDGKQHFLYYEGSWNNKENVQATHDRDLIKNKYCFQHNIPLIRIPFDTEYNFNDLKLGTTRFLLTQTNEKEYYEGRLRL